MMALDRIRKAVGLSVVLALVIPLAAQDSPERTLEARRSAATHMASLLALAVDPGDPAIAKWIDEHYDPTLVASIGRPGALQSARQVAEELAGGTVTRSGFTGPGVFEIALRDCQAGPAMQVVLRLASEPPHRIVALTVNIELAVRADPLNDGITPESIASRVRRELDDMVEHDEFSGAVRVDVGGATVIREARGAASQRWRVPNAPNTRFNLASMGKMFTAVAVLRLVQDGVIGLHDKVGKHVPELRDHHIGTEVTIYHLLTHTSGMTHFWTDDFRRDRADVRTVRGLLPYYVDRPFQFEPGQGWHYSNSGYAVLGLLVEHATGKSFETYLHEAVFEPAGMTRAGLFEIDDPGIYDLAVGYIDLGGPQDSGPARRRSNVMVARARGGPAGGCYATADDVAAFVRALRTHVLLDEEHTALALSRHAERPSFGSKRQWYGLGFTLAEQQGVASWGHAGGAEGISTELICFPALDVVIVVLSNYDRGGDLADRLRAAIVATVGSPK